MQANDLRKGSIISWNGHLWQAVEVHHRTPGNLRAFVQATIRSLKTGKSAVIRFSSTEPIEQVMMTTRKLEFSYKDQTGFHFMDPETYDTVTLLPEFVGDSAYYLTENLPVVLMEVENKPAELELPPAVNLKVVESPPGVKGDTASNVTKPAKLETGLEVGVPLFIGEGEIVRVDTRTGKYLGRS